ncbi:MAG: ABC transporter ATP-binding protein [Fimbriimonadaceae bacterium]|nr:ABC transporter ATP-binding protein [Chthonomonadaceae bacterium]MCO5297712.1 ABC transporter ATP-binding protein [Fimbriimonadaceae bacterium]
MLEVDQLVKQYKQFRALDGLSFTIRPGEIVGLLGPNGAGKTTALRCIAGILRPTSGQARINGHDVVTQQALAKAGLAFVPEVPSLYELLTVHEHLRFVAMCFHKLDAFEQRGQVLLERYHLWEKRDELVATLSKGMKQKLAVACALIHDANVILFDEPMIGIDPAGSHQLKMEIMRQRDAGCAILVSTHLLDTAEKLCDRVIILARGRKLAEGTLEELQNANEMQGQSLEGVFLRLTEEGTDETAGLPHG